MVYSGRSYYFKFFKGCLPQISLGPFVNTLFHMGDGRYILIFGKLLYNQIRDNAVLQLNWIQIYM